MTTRNKIISEFNLLETMFQYRQDISPIAWKMVRNALERTKDLKQAHNMYRAFRHSLGWQK